MVDGVGEGAASADGLVTAAKSAVEAVLAGQRGAIAAWNQEVRRRCVAGGRDASKSCLSRMGNRYLVTQSGG